MTDLMIANDWLSIAEMEKYHTLVLLWKTIYTMKPKHMYNSLSIDENMKIEYNETRLQFTRRGYRHRATRYWNELSQDLREEVSSTRFKRRLKSWIKDQRQRTPDQVTWTPGLTYWTNWTHSPEYGIVNAQWNVPMLELM